MVKSKRGMETTMSVLIVAIILLVFMMIYLGVFKGLFGKEVKVVDRQISRTGDYEKDGVADFADECPCIAGTISNSGCPTFTDDASDMAAREKRDCLG
ncbi:hypothetical protein HYT54_02640 [Candidatus Woesearchaeota archaeon]|nr:hypothetical protein [Candidatus Woesearchaeota archaeon]